MNTITLVINSPERKSVFEIPAASGSTLLDALLYVQEFCDPSVSFNWNCRTAQCGLCALRVLDQPALACVTRVESGRTYEVQPIRPSHALQGLVCDVTELYRHFFAATAERGSERKKKVDFEGLLLEGAGDSDPGAAPKEDGARLAR
jgi:succinate dehydrogenase/fumarate reductase-like Fe-S protein